MLTVHKNTKKQREAKRTRSNLLQDAKALSKLENISGYAVVVWNEDCTADCAWVSTPPVMPGLVVPEFTKQILQRRINCNDTNEIIDERFLT